MRKLPATTLYNILCFATDFFFLTIFTLNQVYQVNVVGLNALQLVLVGTMVELTIAVFEIPTGIVADVYSRRLSIVIGYVLVGLGFIVEGSLPSFLPVMAAQVLWGIGYTFTSGATQAWIADEVGEEQAGKAFVRGAQFSQMGSFAGVVLAVALGSISVQLPIVAGGALMVGLAGFLALAMPENGFRPAPREERNSWQHMAHTFKTGVTLVRASPILVCLVAAGFFFGFYSEGYDRLWPAHLLRNIGLPATGGLSEVIWFGLLRGGAMLLTIAAAAAARKLLDPDSPLIAWRTMLTSSIFLGGGLLTFAVTGNFTLAVAAFTTIFVARRLIEPYYSAVLNRHLESGVRATVFSMSSQMDAAGQILSGPLVGLIGLQVSLQAAILTTVVLLLPVFFFIRKGERLEKAVSGAAG